MKLLLHICCAPCLIFPLERLRQLRIDPTGFFYNPNIAPQGEYLARREALVSYAASVNLSVLYRDGGGPRAYGKRCRECWRERLTQTAAYARAEGFDAFSTTLLVSPYQDHALLLQTGELLEQETGVRFYYEDFRTGFSTARQTARSLGLYMQKYCGCIASRDEREAALSR